MNRQYYLDLAAHDIRFPIGTDLVLQEKPNHAAILQDGRALGKVIEEAARRFKTPLAMPLMDLMIEKDDLLTLMGVESDNPDSFHFDAPPTEADLAKLDANLAAPMSRRLKANVEAITYIAKETDLIPVGMCIGPFSLMTKLIPDPITAVYIAGTGVTGQEDPEVLAVERVLEIATKVILRSIKAQLDAGAKAVCVAEPAPNKAYFSPNQLEENPGIYDRFVMQYNRQIRELLKQHDADLIFHCCGELIDMMVKQFVTLDPAILSLGGSRELWNDAAMVPKTTVLYGNLPSKKFYSDDVISPDQVRAQTKTLLDNMHKTGHPFILGTECDVLSVPGCEKIIRDKVQAMLEVR